MTTTDLDAIRLLLARLGITPEQLLNTPTPTRPMPTIREYIDHVHHAVPAGTQRAYATYWRRIVDVWGNRLLNEPTPLEIMQLAEHFKPHLVNRRNSRGGRTATEHLIGALRCLYHHAVTDQLITQPNNPAARVHKPRRLTSPRHAIPAHQLADINHTASTTGNDPDLDTLLLRLHTETACRRGGALTLTPTDLDHDQCLIRLREKGDTIRWQPVSPTLMNTLTHHHTERSHDDSHAQLLRYRTGQPITARRYDHLWQRLGHHLPWVATQQITTHWLRHTTLTWVERNYGYATARAYAGHTNSRDGGTTSTYVRADIHEIAHALATLTGEPHPMADQLGHIDT
jgi:site-specific recombinase XerD